MNANYSNSSTYKQLSFLSKLGIIFWIAYFEVAQIATLIIYQTTGIPFAQTAYHWIFHTGLIFLCVIAAAEFDRIIIKLGFLPLTILMGYIYFRYLQPEMLVLNPFLFILNIVALSVILVILLFDLVDIFGRILLLIIGRINVKVEMDNFRKRSNLFAIYFIIIFIWLMVLQMSVSAFNQSITITDTGNEVKSVGFWNFPIWSNKIDNYNNSDAREELQIYKELNAFFYIPFSRPILNDPLLRANYSQIMDLFASYNIEVVFDASARPFVWDEKLQDYVRKGDFVTYHYIPEVNDSINAILEFVESENITNFKGISLDIEPANYRNSSYVISIEKYNEAVKFLNDKFANISLQYPNLEFYMISMESIIWDGFDKDYDLSIAAHTMDLEINWDKYGFMTYHVGAKPSYVSSDYYYQLKMGYQLYGNKFQPWLGWWSNDPNSKYPLFDDPEVSARSWEQIKIAKACGVDQIVLAPTRAFKGTNHTAGMMRLNKLKDILENGFEPFQVSLGRKEWYETIFPTYWIAKHEIFHDMIYHSENNWFIILQTAEFIISVVSLYLIYKNKIKKLAKSPDNG